MSKSISLVLGSGGARGYAHIGVIRALEESGYEIKGIAGCSMGALIGGFYAADKLNEFESWARSLTYLDCIKLIDLSFLSDGAIRGDKLFKVLAEILGEIEIQDLAIPFTAVATDLTNQKEVWFNSGSLERAIRASCAIPSLILPVVMDNRVLVDGGVLNPLPIAASVPIQADAIIAVDLSAEVPMPGGQVIETELELASKKAEKSQWFSHFTQKAFSLFDKKEQPAEVVLEANLGKLGIMYEMFETMQASLTQYKIAGYRPDLLIKIPKLSAKVYEFYNAEQQIDLGYKIAQRALEAYERGEANTYGQI
jgi:NTE family protein